MFKYRGIVVTPEDFSGVDWIERCRQAGLNTLGLHSGGGESHDVIYALGELGTQQFRQQVAAAGLNWEYECHAAESLLPRTLFEKNPEFFNLDKITGKRCIEGNWCVSNSEAIHLVQENGIALAKQLPASTHRYLFWGADNPTIWCHCDSCSRLSPSDQMLRSVNALARAIKVADTDAQVPYLGYFDLLEPPQSETPEQNVFLEFAPMHRCYLHSIDDLCCSVNRGYWEKLLKLLDVFDAARTHVLEYWLDSSSFSRFKRPAVKPLFKPKVVAADLTAYRKLGINSITTFAVWMDGEYFLRHGDREFKEYAELVNG